MEGFIEDTTPSRVCDTVDFADELADAHAQLAAAAQQVNAATIAFRSSFFELSEAERQEAIKFSIVDDSLAKINNGYRYGDRV